MANEEHLAILRQGVDFWNQWREDNQGISPDLRISTLSAADLRGADLRNVNLFGANLHGTDLRKTNLRNADLRCTDLRNADLREIDLSATRLTLAHLGGAHLSGAKLTRVHLHESNLSQANLSEANLSEAHLSESHLEGANFSQAKLIRANLTYAHLEGANLRGADLHDADLRDAYLCGADLNNAKISWTVFGNVDLSEVKGLESISHEGPSTIGIDTIYKSKGNIPYKFLLDAGVPKDDIPYLLSLAGKAIDFYSCFISCSSQDKAFVERLHADLQAKGIRCWVAWEDLKIGEPFLLGIDKGIQLHDKLLLVLSENSVTSGWVQHEVLSALAKERGKEPWVLFPVRLDETVMHTSVPWVNMIRQSRHIGDFTHWKDHDAYQKAFDRLLRDLKAEAPK